MTVQELIDALNKIKDKSKRVAFIPNGIDSEYHIHEGSNIIVY